MNRRDAVKYTTTLLGYALSGSTLSAVMSGCQADTSPDWTPTVLSPDQAVLLGELAETILPKTETPGAKELLVHRFIDELLRISSLPKQQQAFAAGLQQLDEDCQAAHSKGFVECSSAQRQQFLTQVEQQTRPIPPSIWGYQLRDEPVGFYRQLKQLILLGYFTSEKIGTEVLNYDPIPGKFVGCVPLSEVGNAWTL